MKRIQTVLFVFVLASSPALAGKPALDPPGHGGAGESSRTYSIDDALGRLNQIEDALASFVAVTELAASRLGPHDLDALGNTDWESQNLGFPNWVDSVKGALYWADYRIAQLELEIATARYEAGEVDLSVVAAAEDRYTVAYTMYVDHLQRSVVVD